MSLLDERGPLGLVVSFPKTEGAPDRYRKTLRYLGIDLGGKTVGDAVEGQLAHISMLDPATDSIVVADAWRDQETMSHFLGLQVIPAVTKAGLPEPSQEQFELLGTLIGEPAATAHGVSMYFAPGPDLALYGSMTQSIMDRYHGAPIGLIVHIAMATPERGIRMFEAWRSQADRDSFMAGLVPEMAANGINPPEEREVEVLGAMRGETYQPLLRS